MLCQIRGATLLYPKYNSVRIPSQDAITSLVLDADSTLRNTVRESLFLRTLSGPFDIVFRTRIPASRALCGGIGAVISASTVFYE